MQSYNMNSFNNMVSGISIMSNGFWLNILGRVEFTLKQIIHDVLQATATTEGEVYFSFWSIRTKSFNTKTSISIQIVYCIRHWNRKKAKRKLSHFCIKICFCFYLLIVTNLASKASSKICLFLFASSWFNSLVLNTVLPFAVCHSHSLYGNKGSQYVCICSSVCFFVFSK